MIMTGGSERRSFARRSGHWMTLSIAALAGTGLAGFATFLFSSAAEAKTPGSTYCYYGTCHRVKTLSETASLIGTRESVHASFYDDCKRDSLNPCGLTSSGEQFHPDRPDNAASPIYPDGTTLLVWSPSSKQAAVLRVNNAGPYWGKRKLDVSRAAAEALGFKPYGVAELQVKVLDAPSRAEATYARNRKYQAVPGPFGKYDSLEEARLSLAVMRAIDEMPTTVAVQAAVAPAIAGGVRHDALDIDLPEKIVVASADPQQPIKAKAKTVQKRQDAKAKRVAAKRKQHYARRNGARRSTVASRRQARGNRYAYHRGAKSRRIARTRTATRSRLVTRQLRGRKPVVTRAVKHRRTAEAQFDRFDMRQPLHGPGLLRDLPIEQGHAERARRLKMPVRGPVQVV
jgi:rare lipoprotein A